MLTYLMIALVVQIIITTERMIRKVAGPSIKTWNLGTYAAFALLAVRNILIWPITIMFEICNIKNHV